MPPTDASEEARRLGDLVNGHPEHVTGALPRLAALLTAADPLTTAAAVRALGHAWDPAAAAVLLDRVPRDHPDERVRLALAQALPSGAGDGELRERVVGALVELVRDDEPRVRDWAAFGLGELRADSPAARDALAALLEDPDDDTRCEAVLALARSGDARAEAALVTRLGGDDGPFTLELEAAAALASPALHPLLQRWADAWAGDEDAFTALLRVALARCHPGAAATARRVEGEVLERVRRLDLPPTGVGLAGRYPRTRLVVTAPDGRGLHLDLWDDGQEPDGYDTGDVMNAVLGTP